MDPITERLTGEIQEVYSLSGELSSVEGLSGELCVPTNPLPYTGEYDVTPKAFETQTLETAGKVLSDNIVIVEIPYFETSNPANGKTVYIAKEV